MRTLRNNPGFLVNFPSVLNDVFGNEFTKPAIGFSRALVNIVENENEYGIELVAPGFKKEDFNIKIEDNKIEISAEVETLENADSVKFNLKEFERQSFKRTFSMPENLINEDEIKANYVNGVLLIALPKREEAKPKAPKQIEIK